MEFIKGHPATSEEKLLQLIRKKNDPSARKPLVSRGDGADLSSTQTPGDGQPRKKNVDSLSLTTRILGAAAAGIFIFILINFRPALFHPEASRPETPRDETTREIKMASADMESSGEIIKEEASLNLEARPFEFYRQTIGSRDIFQAPWEKPLPVATGTSSSAAELAKQLKLVGILLDKDPKAIVEDLTTQQTFFLSPGERIGNAVVEEIREDKVILDFAQEKVELVP